jgi:phospholipid transport system transporter-binding protein
MMSKVILPERLTMSEGRATLEALLPQLKAATIAELDASHLQVLDTAAIALLLACQRQAHAQGRSLLVTGVSDKLRNLARLYGVNELLAI